MGSPPNTAQWGDDAHLPGWLLADAVDDPDGALDQDATDHLKSCPACEARLHQAQSGADEAGWMPLVDGAQVPDLAKLSPLLVSNLAARQTPPFAPGQVWQLVGWHTTELAVITKVEPYGAFVAPLTNDPPELTDPYTVQGSFSRTSIVFAVWFSLETFVHTEVFSRSIDEIDTGLIAAGRTAWRTGAPLEDPYVVGPTTLHNAEVSAYREQIQQRITSLAHVQIVPESADDEEDVPAHVVLRDLGVKTAQVREILDVNAAVAGSIRTGDRSLSYDEAQKLSAALGVEVPATVVDPDPGLIAAVAAPRFRVLFGELASRKGTDEWAERRRAVDRQLDLAARTTDSDGKWEQLLDRYLIAEFKAAKAAGEPEP